MKNIKWLKEEIEKEIEAYNEIMKNAYSGYLYDQYKNKKEVMESVLKLINETSEENKEGLDLNRLNKATEGAGIVMTVGTVFLTEIQAEWIENLRNHSKKCRRISELEIIKMAQITTLKSINKLAESPITLIHAYRGFYEVKKEKEYRIRAGEHYVKFNLDGTMVGVKKNNSKVTKSRLDKLPFDVDKAVESGIIVLEEVEHQ